MANGLPAFLLQVTIDSTNKWVDFGYTTGSYEVSIAEGDYSDIIAVLDALMIVMDAACSLAGGFNYSIGTDGKVTIWPTNANTFTLDWESGTHGSSGTNANLGPTLGFSTSADDTGATTYTSDNQHKWGWYDENGLAHDSRDRWKSVGPGTFIAVSGAATRSTLGEYKIRRVEIDWITKEKFFVEFADANEDFETFWKYAARGVPFSFYYDTDESTWTDEGTYVLIVAQDENLLDSVPRLSEGEEYYSVTMNLIQQ